METASQIAIALFVAGGFAFVAYYHPTAYTKIYKHLSRWIGIATIFILYSIFIWQISAQQQYVELMPLISTGKLSEAGEIAKKHDSNLYFYVGGWGVLIQIYLLILSSLPYLGITNEAGTTPAPSAPEQNPASSGKAELSDKMLKWIAGTKKGIPIGEIFTNYKSQNYPEFEIQRAIDFLLDAKMIMQVEGRMCATSDGYFMVLP